MSRKRRSHEAGHKRKYLVVIDDSPECDRAVYWASQRAARNNSSLIMLRVIETEDRNQQWLGVADIMKAEAHEAANAALDKFANRANGVAGLTPERAVREGEVSEEILNLIEQDEETFLPWARERYACIIFNLHVEHTPRALDAAAAAFRELIDIAISHGGSYYLTYHRWARMDQVER